jgi:hypothetical protein
MAIASKSPRPAKIVDFLATRAPTANPPVPASYWGSRSAL